MFDIKNHFLLENEKLIQRLVDIVEESILIYPEIDPYGYENYKYRFTYRDNPEFYEVKKELLYRMKEV